MSDPATIPTFPASRCETAMRAWTTTFAATASLEAAEAAFRAAYDSWAPPLPWDQEKVKYIVKGIFSRNAGKMEIARNRSACWTPNRKSRKPKPDRYGQQFGNRLFPEFEEK